MERLLLPAAERLRWPCAPNGYKWLDVDCYLRHLEAVRIEGHYILEGKTPVPCYELLEWAAWYETAKRQVAETQCNQVRVSTVFLSLDHSFCSGRAPILFETMVFGGELEGEMDRYHTWEEAEAGHKVMVARVMAHL